ncbi:MAG: pantoate--beta-alanine ligase [Actinomycetota bacterium]|nr:pantoate--beta-alanine ligase [Actinomycetota bacterium]
MEVIREAGAFSRLAESARMAGRAIGFVPTMGGLHEGHDALIHRARDRGGFVAVSIFVNPTQFGPGEDLARYPRDEAADLARCEQLEVDAVWAPPVSEVYPPGVEAPSPDPGPVGDTFEGASRPGHFRGVLMAVHRLLSVTGPTSAYFGEKDAQQLFLVRRMVTEQGLPARIVACPTVRGADGVARSSRNRSLTAEELEQAPSLFLGLSEAAAAARTGERSAAALIAAIAREVGAATSARMDYVAVVDEATFEPVTEVDGPARAIVAARFSDTRLIDNLLLPSPAG